MSMHPPSPLGKENNSSEECELAPVDRSKSSPAPATEAPDLLAKCSRGRGVESPPSPGDGNNATTPYRGRKGSDMKYSSISPPESRVPSRVPSAKTISDRCFPIEVSFAASSSPESLFSDCTDDERKDGQQRAEACALNANVASPTTEAIKMEMIKVYQSAPIPESYFLSSPNATSPSNEATKTEMNKVYESSPIPESYLRNSPPKKTPALPEITLHPDSANKSHPKIAKKNMEASKLLAKQAVGRRSSLSKGNSARSMENARGDGISNSSFAAAKSAYGGGIKTRPRRTQRSPDGRETFSAPNESAGVAKSQEWDLPSDSKPTRSTKSAGMTTRSKSKENQPAALSVQREKRQRKQRLKEAESAPKSEVDGRRNLDKRTARLRFAAAFRADIAQHRQNHPRLNNASNHSDKAAGQIQGRGTNGVSIAVRKRPMFDYELDRGDYDVVSIDNATGGAHDAVVIHNGVMHADMKQMLMKPTRYPGLTAAFDEYCNDDDIYKHIAEPLVLDAASGGVATVLMFGQTGSGKSHTMAGIEGRAADGLFRSIDSKFEEKPIGVSIQFVELCGSKECRDLLVKKSDGQVKLADNEDGSVRLLNAATCEAKSPGDLLGKINLAKSRRKTEATDKNGVSSRSHAVCQIQIRRGKSRGVLTLIDCAGSERKHDSMYHSSERQKETAEINASLYALKECIRARAGKSARIPFRSSSLTRVLKESFERDGARLCVIACVAPNATDTEHTMETLKTVANIVGVENLIKEEKAHNVASRRNKPATLPPKMWSHERLFKFLIHKRMHRVQLSDKHDGKTLMKMSVPQMRAQLFEDRDKDLAQKLFDLLRKENDRIALIQRKERANLKEQMKGRV